MAAGRPKDEVRCGNCALMRTYRDHNYKVYFMCPEGKAYPATQTFAGSHWKQKAAGCSEFKSMGEIRAYSRRV